jgi:ATP-dependent exoDNAse (exonuclease V) beta subunit
LGDLHVLAGDNQGVIRHSATIWQLMHDETRLKNLSEDGLLRLTHVKTVLTVAFNGQGRMPVRRWLESTWLQLGGGKCLVDAGDNRDVQVFFDLVEKTSRSGHLDIAALELGMQKLYAKPDIDAPDNLQFLTIHKSKGLEFDTVILPALNRQPRHADNELVLWQEVVVDKRLHLIAAPLTSKVMSKKSASPNVYEFLKELEKERANNEIVRLLYVAATRTQRQLHVIASVQPNQKGEIKPVANSLLQVLWPAVEADFNAAIPQPLPATAEQTLDISQFKPQLQRLHSSEFSSDFLGDFSQHLTKNHNQYASPEDEANATTSCFNEPLTSIDLYKNCGILAHLYMELFAKTDLKNWHKQRLAQCQPAMRKWLMQQGHTTKHAEQGATQVQAALQTTINSEAGRWVLKPHAEAMSELSVMQATDTGVQNHVIDRTFVDHGIDGKNIRWIVDYKLTTPDENEDLTVVAVQHRPQLERYARLFASEGLQIKCAIYFLSSGNLVELQLS